MNGESSPSEEAPAGMTPPTDVPEREEQVKSAFNSFSVVAVVLFLDAVCVMVLMMPVMPEVPHEHRDWKSHYTVYGSLWDVSIVSIARIVMGIYALYFGYQQKTAPPKTPFNPLHRNGDKKTSEELEEEALEESWAPWLRRYVARFAFGCEILAFVTTMLLVVKCLGRLAVEVGVFGDRYPFHPIFWTTLFVNAVTCNLEGFMIDTGSQVAGRIGRARRRRFAMGSRVASSASLSQPLLDENDVEANDTQHTVDTDVIGVSDITADSTYKAGWGDLLNICYPDIAYIMLALVFLVGAAVAQVLIPYLTGELLDILINRNKDVALSNLGSAASGIWAIPHFRTNIIYLILASVFGGLFSGLRGAIFTVVGGRANVRLRVMLMDSLLAQDIGFFDVTKTGDVTSRLSSDTTLVGDQVSLNVNIFLRSLVQAIGVLGFMLLISWQLTLLAFISVPVVSLLSRWYGELVRRLSKLMQKKLADGNSVSEAAMSSMSTVRAFGAESGELNEFCDSMGKYLYLNFQSAVLYCGYASTVTALPQVVTALVLFYGGLLIQSEGSDHIRPGQLVSFLLYLSSLSEAFFSIGYIFSSLTQAVGAADKVFELMNRKPKLKSPTATPEVSTSGNRRSRPKPLSVLGIVPKHTNLHKEQGMRPESCVGAVTLSNVEMYYPARPKRRVLNDLSLTAPPGHVIALVGPSGSGKSSIVSLVQHLYEPSGGEVSIDGNKVFDLNSDWLYRNVSVVSQEPTLFARSIKRNIMYGLEGTDAEPSMEEIMNAARLANAHDFVESLPFGYETDVGERGVQLSGGQKQRIAIARALVRKPRVLLLDEATSALDAESEAAVQEAIDKMLLRDRSASTPNHQAPMTVMVVAHRLSTVKGADKIYVIDGGKVVEAGTHNQLIQEKDGAYSKLVNRQLAAQKKLEGDETKETEA